MLTEGTILVIMVARLTTFVFPYSCVITSPGRWPECRPKHVGEKFVKKYIINMEVHFDGYLYILDLTNARKMALIIITKKILNAKLNARQKKLVDLN